MSSNPKLLYETDFAEWSDRTAALIRAGKFDQVDAENVAEEIESLGKSEFHQLGSRITQILEHLLKLRETSGPLRDQNERGWRGSIRRQQGEIARLLSNSPSLRRRLTPEMLAFSYRTAAGTVAVEYDVKPPAKCPFGWSDVLPAEEKRRKKAAK
jgi:hypothetical protein